jgi:hypothetical protein
MKLYSIKLQTKLGELVIDDVKEYVFARQYMYYSKADETVGRIARQDITKAFRQLEGSTRWVEIRPKKFNNHSKQDALMQ